VNVWLAAPPAEGAGREAHVSVGRVVVPDAPVEVRLGNLRPSRGIAALEKSVEFLLCVEDHDHERRPRYVLAAPTDLYSVVSWLRGFVFTQNCAILLGFTLHFNSKCSFRSSDSDSELTRACASCVTDKSRLIPCQDTMFDSRAVDANLARVGGGGDAQVEGGPWDVVPAVLDAQAVTPALLGSNEEREPPVSVVVEL